MNNEIIDLIKLSTENPTLEIITMTHYEVCCSDEFSYWKGDIEKVEKNIYFEKEYHGDIAYVIGKDKIEDHVLSDSFPDMDFCGFEDFVNKFCKEAIFVYINI